MSCSDSTENGEKEEIPEPPPEPPKKTAPPPKKEETRGTGPEFWGELEVQRVKFLVRIHCGHQKLPLTSYPPQLPTPALSSSVPRSPSKAIQAGKKAELPTDRARTWAQCSYFQVVLT
jgi:hypothetical protein